MESWTAWYEQIDPKNHLVVRNRGTVFVYANTYQLALNAAYKAASEKLGGAHGLLIKHLENQADEPPY